MINKFPKLTCNLSYLLLYEVHLMFEISYIVTIVIKNNVLYVNCLCFNKYPSLYLNSSVESIAT